MTVSWNRKNQHIHFAEMNYQEQSHNGLDGVRFIHHSFANVTPDQVSLTTTMDNLTLDYPFFINAMTGGSDKAYTINKNLATVAKETGLAMAVGSVSIALSQPETAESFKIVRKTNPNGLIFSNLGAHHSVENAKRAVDLLEADALQLHLNIPQELVMPEGDRDFYHWLKNIESIVKGIETPVMVKEVGFGMSKKTIQQLINVGVTMIDVAGKGGTNFIQIENERREHKEYDYLYDWGQTTAESLLEAYPFARETHIIASGGIRTPLDMLRAFALGANTIGLSGEILHQLLTTGNDATILRLNQWKEELTYLMVMINAKSIEDITSKQVVLSHELRHWCKERRIVFHN